MNSVWLNEKQAAKYLNVSTSYLSKARMTGICKNHTPGPKFSKVGKFVRYHIENLDGWLLSGISSKPIE